MAAGDGVRAWRFLRHVSEYEAAWRARAAVPTPSGGGPGQDPGEPGPAPGSGPEPAPDPFRGRAFPVREQTRGDLDAARFDLLAWADPRAEDGPASPFWVQDDMPEAAVAPDCRAARPLLGTAGAGGAQPRDRDGRVAAGQEAARHRGGRLGRGQGRRGMGRPGGDALADAALDPEGESARGRRLARPRAPRAARRVRRSRREHGDGARAPLRPVTIADPAARVRPGIAVGRARALDAVRSAGRGLRATRARCLRNESAYSTLAPASARPARIGSGS